MKRTPITNPEITKESLRAELKKTKAARKALRILGLLRIMEGKQIKETVSFFGCNRTTVTNWIKNVNEKGLAGLEEDSGRGLKSRLSLEQKEQLKNDLKKTPQDFGFNQVLWTGKIIREHIKRKFKVSYQETNVYLILKDLGFTLQRPTRKYLGQNITQQRKFKKELKKNLTAN